MLWVCPLALPAVDSTSSPLVRGEWGATLPTEPVRKAGTTTERTNPRQMMKTREPQSESGLKSALTLCLLAFALCSPASAQSFSIDWYSIDSGGGTSTGGAFAVSGRTGQPDPLQPIATTPPLTG